MSRPPHALRRRLACAAIVGAVATGGGAPLLGKTAAAAPAAVSDADRVTYWLDRIVRGAEPGDARLPDFHQGLLASAQRALADLPALTLDRLEDDALRRRLQTQPDTNPWHGLLTVLVEIGRRRPAVARAWARPALGHEDVGLRRQGVEVLLGLGDPVDTPDLLDAVRRDAGDRVVVPTIVRGLVGLGAPSDGAVARVVLEVATDDGAGVGSTGWAAVAGLLGTSSAPSRDDALAWTALLAETSGPLAPWPAVRRAGGGDALEVARPETLRLSGRLVAAVARVPLSRAGHAAWRAVVDRDLAGDDADLATIATAGRPRSPDEIATLLAAARALPARFAAADPRVTPALTVDVIESLRQEKLAERGTLLATLLDAMPADPRYAEAFTRAFLGAREGGVEPVDGVARHLASGERVRVDLALKLARAGASVAYLDVVDRWIETDAAAPFRVEGRRTTAFLYGVVAAKGGVATARAEAFAARLAAWAEDPRDPSGAALGGALLDLGAAGERALAAGLRGARRADYLDVLASGQGRRIGAEVAAAIAAGIGDETPAALRTAAWTALFRCAGPDAVPALEAAVARLTPPARAEGEAVLRVVAHRVQPRP